MFSVTISFFSLSPITKFETWENNENFMKFKDNSQVLSNPQDVNLVN